MDLQSDNLYLRYCCECNNYVFDMTYHCQQCLYIKYEELFHQYKSDIDLLRLFYNTLGILKNGFGDLKDRT